MTPRSEPARIKAQRRGSPWKALRRFGLEVLLARPVEVRLRAERRNGDLSFLAEFVRNLEALRTKYKIQRNFIKLVEQKRKWSYLS